MTVVGVVETLVWARAFRRGLNARVGAGFSPWAQYAGAARAFRAFALNTPRHFGVVVRRACTRKFARCR